MMLKFAADLTYALRMTIVTVFNDTTEYHSMYICICHEVTDRHIRKAVSEGAATLRDLRTGLGVASQCGKCGVHARIALQQALAERSQVSLSGAA